MAFIDLVRWAPQSGATIYAWRFPHTNLSTATQLIVQESQEALFFSKGQLVGKFGPGKHTLSTENLPLLRHLYGLPFGGKNPFTAEVWFVNKIQVYNIPWKTDAMSVHDAAYETHLPLCASGQYGLKIVDSEKFLIKVVGTKSQFTESDLTSQFTGEFTTKVKSRIVMFMNQNNISFKQISAYFEMMSDSLRKDMTEFWAELGLELTKFYVSTVDIDTSTEEGRRVKSAIATQSTMSITGHTWQQEQMIGTANRALDGFSSGIGGGGGGGLLGGLMAMNMMNNMTAGGGMGGMMNPQFDQPKFGVKNQGGGAQANQGGGYQANQGAVKMVFCSNCANRYPSTSRFCPKCGDPYNPCPRCGADNDDNARRCVSCGAQLIAGGATPGVGYSSCPQCNSPITPGAAFCASCGAQLKTSNVCGRCGKELSPKDKFCPVCGMKC